MKPFDITLKEAEQIIDQLRNGRISRISAGKNGRAWLEGEFNLAELEAICVMVRAEAGNNAMGANELINHWKTNNMIITTEATK